MNYKLRWAATEDIRQIEDWVASNFGEAAADKAQRRLYREFELIAEAQSIGILRPEITRRPIRFLASWPNWIAYEPGTPVVIHRVFPARMDVSKLRL